MKCLGFAERNADVEARQGDGKSLPRGEGFRVRVTFTRKSA